MVEKPSKAKPDLTTEPFSQAAEPNFFLNTCGGAKKGVIAIKKEHFFCKTLRDFYQKV